MTGSSGSLFPNFPDENWIVGEFIADNILELKSVERIVQAHEVQRVNYLVYPVILSKNQQLRI